MRVEKEVAKPRKRKIPWLIGSIVAASFVTLVLLQASNLWKDFTIESSSDLLLLYALSGLNFAALIIFGFIFLRSIIKLVRERRTFTLGAKIKTRLLIYFFSLSLLPIIAMAFFSYLFMNRALDRWFTSIPETVLNETKAMQSQSLLDRTTKLDESARMLATSFERAEPENKEISSIAAAGSLVYIGIWAADDSVRVAYQRDLSTEEQSDFGAVLSLLRSGRVAEPELRDGKGFDVGMATLSGGRRLIIVPDPYGERTLSAVVERSVKQFEDLKERQITIRRLGLLTLGVLTFLLIFASTWIAFYVARGLTAPIKALAEGAEEIAQGNLSHRVDVLAEDELALLVSTFNEMSAKLESNSIEIGNRRRYIETVLETLPNGVVSFDNENKITTVNESALHIFKKQGAPVSGLSDLVGSGEIEMFETLIARARRIGRAAGQITIKDEASNGNGIELTVSLTATRLPADDGVVLVIEDLSELIAAQRASAWQEVARRMAHEIKNPLTPIQLSAERIAKRFASSGHEENGAVRNRINDKGPISNMVQESTATILREVTSLKTMVDEFSRFARLPDTRLEPGDLNSVVEQAKAVFDGRFTQLVIDLELADDLPAIMLDHEQMKRIFVNLIENAVEAFDGNVEAPRIAVSTRFDPARDLIVAEVADNGKGIAPADLQKLFQPYFSTKGRGTGLGLAIVKRIITEHNGRINVVTNQPHGAKFIIELPVNG